MDPRPRDVSGKDDDTQPSVSSSSTAGERTFAAPVEGVALNADQKDSKLVERVQDMALESSTKTEWTTSTASIHLTTNVANKAGMFEEEEEGELDYEEDEGEIPGEHEDRNGMKNDTEGDKEEGELEDGDEEEGEEGEILSDEDDKETVSEKKSQDNQDSTVTETDGPEEGEVIEEGESSGGQSFRKKVCRYFIYGGCTWGMSCRFLHPGLNDKGAYQMLPVPGQYPSPFPKAPAVFMPPVPPEAMVQAPGMPSLPDQDDAQVEGEIADQMPLIPEVSAPPKKETAWERGLKLAKEIKKAAQKRKEEDADFQEKRMVLGITAEEEEDENDKENLMRRREMMRARLDKDPIFEEDDARHHRGGDIVSRWRDKKQTSSDQYRDRDRRKRRVNRSPSSSPERDRRSRRKGGEKEKQKGKLKETVRERDKERTKKPEKEVDKKHDEKAKKQKEKGSDSGKEKPIVEQGENETEVTQEKVTDEQTSSAVKQELKSDEKKTEDERKRKALQEKSTDSGKEAAKRDEINEGGGDEKDKSKTKALGISSSRLPNDEWMDPWQRTTSPKRHSVSSHSSRSRSSSSSSDSSRSSQSRSHSGSESRSTSRSASQSRSRSGSQTPSRSPSRSRSGSQSKSRSRSGSVSSASDHSSSSSSSKEMKGAPSEGGEEKVAKQASPDSSQSESESNKSPIPVEKSPAKPKTSPDRGPRTPPVQSSTYRDNKERRNRYEYSQAEKIQKWQEGQMRQGSPWDRRVEGTRPVEDPYSRDRGYHSRRKRSPERRRRSRSPRPKNEDRRRADEGRTRERSSSADSMEHALARPSSPRATRERGGVRRGSSVSSSGSESTNSDTRSESEEERHPVRTRRAGPEADHIKQTPIVPLTSGNIRYTGHKDIKLTLNKSVIRTDSKEPFKPQSQHSQPARTEANSTSEKLQAAKKRPREPSPVSDVANDAKEAVSSSVMPQSVNKPDKRSADLQAEPTASGKPNTANNTSSRREELLRELKAVEDAIARKRARIE